MTTSSLMHHVRSGRILTLAVLLAAGSLTGCASYRPDYAEPEQPPRRQLTHIVPQSEAADHAREQFAVYDPLETTNRRVYKFNAKFDDYVFLPVVDAYNAVTPVFVRKRVHKFFQNLDEVGTFTNSVLQLSPTKAGTTLGRFALNSTVGVLGFFDVATPIGLTKYNEDFGQTLGHYGVGTGPYLMLPILGPSNVRDTVGTVVDAVTFAWLMPDAISDNTAFYVVQFGARPIDVRANNSFRYHGTGSPFEYELVRFITDTGRKVEVAK